jgi:hypothetical protein
VLESDDFASFRLAHLSKETAAEILLLHVKKKMKSKPIDEVVEVTPEQAVILAENHGCNPQVYSCCLLSFLMCPWLRTMDAIPRGRASASLRVASTNLVPGMYDNGVNVCYG